MKKTYVLYFLLLCMNEVGFLFGAESACSDHFSLDMYDKEVPCNIDYLEDCSQQLNQVVWEQMLQDLFFLQFFIKTLKDWRAGLLRVTFWYDSFGTYPYLISPLGTLSSTIKQFLNDNAEVNIHFDRLARLMQGVEKRVAYGQRCLSVAMKEGYDEQRVKLLENVSNKVENIYTIMAERTKELADRFSLVYELPEKKVFGAYKSKLYDAFKDVYEVLHDPEKKKEQTQYEKMELEREFIRRRRAFYCARMKKFLSDLPVEIREQAHAQLCRDNFDIEEIKRNVDQAESDRGRRDREYIQSLLDDLSPCERQEEHNRISHAYADTPGRINYAKQRRLERDAVATMEIPWLHYAPMK